MMISEGFRADIGKEQYIKHQKELIQALRQLANALGVDKAYCDSENFFCDFLGGFWEPYEEAADEGNRQQKQLNQEIRAYKNLIESKISPEANELLGSYVDLLGTRNSEILNYAFLIGYQSAFRFILLGLSSPTEVLPEGVS